MRRLKRAAGLNQLGPPRRVMQQLRGHNFGGLTRDQVAEKAKRGQRKIKMFGGATNRKRPITLATINLPPDNG